MSIYNELKQVIGRSNRSLDDDSHVEVHIVLPKGQAGQELLRMMEDDMPNAVFIEDTWYGLGDSRDEKAQGWADEILSGFTARNTLGKAIPLTLCVKDKDALRNVRRSRHIWKKIRRLVAKQGVNIRVWNGTEEVIDATRMDKHRTWIISKTIKQEESHPVSCEFCTV